MLVLIGMVIRYVVGYYVLISPSLINYQKQTTVKPVSGEGDQLDTYAEGAQQGPSVHNTGTNDPSHIDSGIDGPETTEIQRYWELEQSETQILDVQGRLKNQLSFWKEVLQAPVPIIECISEGYK